MGNGDMERAEKLVGVVINDKYRLDSVLGVGGMASVYAATHRNGRQVALKLLHAELGAREDVKQRFAREGAAANSVGHPGVAIVLDDDQTAEGVPFLVMELLAGHSIEAMWTAAGHKLPERDVLEIVHAVCDVLVAAHAKGVVHRDIKPANLFLTNDGQLKVLDFGIASVAAPTSKRMTVNGHVFGTPSFLPPEQAAGRTDEIDARTDLWALGAVMWTLLSGRMVYHGDSAQHVVLLAATTPAASLASVLPHANPALIAFVDRALQFEPSNRFQSAVEMRHALLALLEPPPKRAAAKRSATFERFVPLCVFLLGALLSITVVSGARRLFADPKPVETTEVSP